jgi:uncharacterized protein
MLEASPHYLADGMLGSTARKLRILGFDTIYDAESDDEDLARSALSTGRILLTGDRELYFYAKKLKVTSILVKGLSEKEKLFQVLSASGIGHIDINQPLSRCSICNGELESTGTNNQQRTEVFSCAVCGKKYWRGSHWKKMIALFSEVNSRLDDLDNQKKRGVRVD